MQATLTFNAILAGIGLLTILAMWVGLTIYFDRKINPFEDDES